MITRQDIAVRVSEWGVAEEVVEQDYVLGWVAFGLGTDELLQRSWVLKGGNCLRKCYIETYRFSGDLDYSVIGTAVRGEEDIEESLKRILARIQSLSGIRFDTEVKLRRRPSGSIEGRIYYVGPRETPNSRAIKLDITLDEDLARPPILRPIAHPYPDRLPAGPGVRCYEFDEVFAEKIRAMSERGRPRDLYDIVNLFRRNDLRLYPQDVASALARKCASKGVPLPSLETFEESISPELLRRDWSKMLAGKLVVVPELEPFLAELPVLFDWLDGQVEYVEAEPSEPEENEDLSWSPPATIATWGEGVPVEVLRFASTNQLLVELGYNQKLRLIEPYSLRRSHAGDLLLHAERSDGSGHRSYRLDRTRSLEATKIPFTPQQPIEFSRQGPAHAPLQTRRLTVVRSVRPRRATYGSDFVYECVLCGKRFHRRQRNSLNRLHKNPQGQQCRGRASRYLGRG